MNEDGYSFSDPLDQPYSATRSAVPPAARLGAIPGAVFVLAAGGLRHLNSVGDGFLGYSSEEIFWKDLLELVHEKDLPRAGALLSEVMHKPGTSLSARLRFRDASGDWRTMDFAAQNVLEAPNDAGLLVVNVREVTLRREDGSYAVRP